MSEKEKETGTENNRVFMVCTNDETAKDVGDCLKRVAATLSAVDTYFDATCQLDEESADFEEKFTPVYLRFLTTLMVLYPDARQLLADAKTLGDFTTRKIEVDVGVL